jgi:hypothetical protein
MTSPLVPSQEPPLRERIGGRWALSWQATVSGTALVICLATITGGGLGVSAPDAQTIPLWFFAAWVGAIAELLYIGLGNVTVFRNRRVRSLPVAVVVMFHAGIGVVFAVGFLLTVRALGLTLVEPPLQTIVGFALAGLWFCMSMALLLDARDRFMRERRLLVDEVVALEVAEIHQSQVVKRLREWGSLHGGDLTKLTNTDATVRNLLPLDAWWKASSDQRNSVGSTLEGSFREAVETHFPRPAFGDVVREVWTAGTLSALGTGTVMAIAYYRATVGALGVVQGLAAVAAIAAITAGALLLVQRATPQGFVQLVLGVGIAAGIGWISVAMVAPELSAAGLVSVAFAVALGAVVFVILPASVRSLRRTWLETNAQLRELIAQRLQLQVDEARHLAEATHALNLASEAQPAVLACAAGLAQAAKSERSDRLTAALQWSAAVLEDALSDSPEANVSSALSATISPWLGLVAISLDVSAAAGRWGEPVSTSSSIVLQEGLTFACGQAAAQHVRVEARFDDGAIRMRIDHDGAELSEDDLPMDARWRTEDSGRSLLAEVACRTDPPAVTFA